MAVQIKCFVCNGVTSDDRECRVCEGKGQIESLLQLRVEDLKNWAEWLQQQQQELDAQHQEIHEMENRLVQREEEIQQLSRQITKSGAPSSDQDQAAIMRELVVSLSKLITELEKKEDFLPPP